MRIVSQRKILGMVILHKTPGAWKQRTLRWIFDVTLKRHHPFFTSFVEETEHHLQHVQVSLSLLNFGSFKVADDAAHE